jgi:hypothetical protein
MPENQIWGLLTEGFLVGVQAEEPSNERLARKFTVQIFAFKCLRRTLV